MLVRRRKRVAACLAGLLLTIGLSGSGTAAVVQSAPDRAISAAGSRAVTLVTGDRVRLTTVPGVAQPAVTIEPGPGRGQRIQFFQTVDTSSGFKDVTVTPSDALPLVEQGKLDRRLFNVSALVRNGFDRSGDTLPLIVSHEGRAPQTVLGKVTRVTRALPSLDASAVAAKDLTSGAFWHSLTRNGTAKLAAGIGKVWLDGTSHLMLDRSAAQVGAPAAWKSGITGKGATVAVVDGGYDPGHPDLEGVVTEARDFTSDPSGTKDGNGHGTHVASTVAGSGAAEGGTYRGIAPDAKLLIAKVCKTDGFCQDSAIISAMEWAADKGARAVNLSLGTNEASDGTDPLSQAVNKLTAETGTLFVAAAGNVGFVRHPVSSPGAADAALTVGSVTKADALSDFSRVGPRIGDFAVKPDIVAPGQNIGAARGAGTALGSHSDIPGDGPINDNYTRASGTSMATPHVTGAVALLAQQHPNWKAEQFKAALTGSSKRLPELTVFQQGAGRLDVARATAQKVTAQTSVSFGKFSWPRGEPVNKTIRYRNYSAAPVTLDLKLDSGAPAGVFRLGTEQVTVPAGGSAEAEVTIDPRAQANHLQSGHVVATSGDVVVHTAIGAFLEPESYDLTVRLTDRAGQVVTGNNTSHLQDVVNLATGATPTAEHYDPATGTHTLRLIKGDYNLNGYVSPNATGTQPDTVIFAKPSVRIDRDMKLVLDGKATVPITTTVERPTAAPIYRFVGFRQTIAGHEVSHNISSLTWGQEKMRDWYITPTEPVTDRPYRFDLRQTLSEQDSGSGNYPPKPADYCYNLLFVERGGIPDKLHYEVKDADLAQVRTHYNGQRTGVTAPDGAEQWNLSIVDGAFSFDAPPYIPAQGTAMQYFSGGPHIRWLSRFEVKGPHDAMEETAAAETHLPGQRYDRSWNSAALSPADTARRIEDRIVFASSPFSPSEFRHYGSGASDPTVTNTLSLDGKVIGKMNSLTGSFGNLPAEMGRYTLTTEATRPESSLTVLGSSTTVTRTFESSRGAGTTELPLLTVRASGAFDRAGQAPAGRRFALTLRVETPEGAASTTTGKPALQVSFDDGKTWQPVRVDGQRNRAVAIIDHPAGPGFASLRMSAQDAAGNTVQQTMIRAYAISKQ
ncbi:S8 family serine peptidase [Streptomyces sp. KR80]|uniref:S8 family serine peptidase n=1 Tax=Streptomyces sp. KR80 TaxID=3457426 RepID=UPI003FCFD876